MRDLVTRLSFRIRKFVDDFLFWMMPNRWMPLYNSVSFSHMPYKKCLENRKWQDNVNLSLRYHLPEFLFIVFAFRYSIVQCSLQQDRYSLLCFTAVLFPSNILRFVIDLITSSVGYSHFCDPTQSRIISFIVAIRLIF